MMGRREWAHKLMNEKEVACNDDKLQQGTAQTVVHINPSKENSSYEAILSCSSTLVIYPPQRLQESSRKKTQAL